MSRNTFEGAKYHDLRRLSRKQGRPFDQILTQHALEGFLARLASSRERDLFVLKGGLLLAAFDLRRTTRDVDIQARDFPNDADAVLGTICGIAQLDLDDGLRFETTEATAEMIREEDEYFGVRVSMSARLATAWVHFHVDVNVGDPITPAPRVISLPRLLGDPVTLQGYPMSLVHAEKVVTALSRGTANTRWRDFGDVYALAALHRIQGRELTESLTSVASYRKVDLRPLASVLGGYAPQSQGKYAAWRRKQQRDDLPQQLQEVLDRVLAFADPALNGEVADLTWDPIRSRWM